LPTGAASLFEDYTERTYSLPSRSMAVALLQFEYAEKDKIGKFIDELATRFPFPCGYPRSIFMDVHSRRAVIHNQANQSISTNA
jgi:hypothetical protein